MLCPLCTSSVPASSLESHFRRHLNYTALRCLLCSLEFFSAAEARAHFAGRAPAHPGQPPRLAELREEALEERMEKLTEEAGGAEEECRGCGCERSHWGRVERSGESEEMEAPVPEKPPMLAYPSELESEAPPPPPQSLEAPPPQPLAWPPQPRAFFAPQPPSQPRAYSPPEPAPKQEAFSLAQVKSEAVEAKPLADADGKVSCLLCAKRVDGAHLKAHARSAHVAAPPFLCRLCPHTARHKHHLQRHLKRTHQAALTPATATVLDLKKEVERVLVECFGELQSVQRPKAVCRECGVSVDLGAKTSHVAVQHLGQPVHRCRLCDFTSAQLSPREVGRHLRKEHGEAVGEETCHSEQERYAAIVDQMIPSFFH